MARPGMPNPYQWQKIRQKVIARDGPWCQNPRGKLQANFPALAGADQIDIDHIIPLRSAPWLAVDLKNLRVSCQSCNRGEYSSAVRSRVWV